MTNQELSELMSCFDRSTAQTMKLSTQAFTIELTRGGAAAPAAPAQAAVPAAPAGKTIDAPLVGTYYTAAAPDQPPFVVPGDRVRKGQTVCLIEAMKMLSEVPAPCDCIVEELLQENGALVAFGAPLLRYREA